MPAADTSPIPTSVSELPFGLRYDQGRHEINGTPRYPAPPPGVEIVLTARDQAGNAVERAFNIEILACALTLDPLADRTFTAGSSIDPLTLPAARAPCGAVTYSVNGLPDGLMFDPETRTLSGDADGHRLHRRRGRVPRRRRDRQQGHDVHRHGAFRHRCLRT